MSRTALLLGEGFSEWELLNEALTGDLRTYIDADPQFFSDLVVLMKRAQAGTCRRALRNGVVPDDGDWDSPLAASRRDMAELRMPYHSNGWVPRLYVSGCEITFGIMIALKFGDKGTGDDALDVQTMHIREAEARLNERDLAKARDSTE